MAAVTSLRGLGVLLRNLMLAAALYALILATVELIRNPNLHVTGNLGIPAFLDNLAPPDIVKTTESGVQVIFATTSTPVTINPHANVFNRPKSAVVPKDDYLGPRPHVDTEADLHRLVEECRGTYHGIEKMPNVYNCMQFLAHQEKDYYALPADPAMRASSQDPTKAEYLDADGHGNSLMAYPSNERAQRYGATTSGSCSGPIIPYHVWWTGPATWRVEIFVKSYLYTQNLACSRLWIWVDSDGDPDAVKKILSSDPLFARFLPFVQRGDIVVREWKFPRRIPLPKREDNTDGVGYYESPGKPNSQGEIAVADGIVQDAETGQEWLVLTPKQMTFLPQAVSDAVRFVVLHLHGGAYFDMDVLLLRDMRPLLLPSNHSFAERWAAHSHPGDYNTAVMSLTANSSLSSYLLRGGVRMGLNFHPRVIGRMAWKDGRDKEFLMMETAVFDPIWTEFNWAREGRCTVPCLRDYGAVFKGTAGAIRDEWESFDGPRLPEIGKFAHHGEGEEEDMRRKLDQLRGTRRGKRNHPDTKATEYDLAKTSSSAASDEAPIVAFQDSIRSTTDEEAELRKAGVIAEYEIEEDKYVPNNRTLENFFRGSWTYHLHNQWSKHPEPSSWISVMQHAHNGFFARERTNMYGEKWDGPSLVPYNYWPEYV